jgi:putative transposase
MPNYRRKLPHWHPKDAYVFITWRLYGSLPAKPDVIRYPTPGHAFVARDRALDRQASGPRWLADARIARIVMDAIHVGVSEREFYHPLAWTIMPNHVHLLILPKVEVPVLMRWLKGSTARRANELLGRTGERFWQDESYDRWIRDRGELERVIRYVERNPVNARLVTSEELWPWSSASGQAEPPTPHS